MSGTMQALASVSYPPLKKNRTFHLILAGHLTSILGDGFHSVAIGLWVLQTTGSAKAISLVMGVKIIISILLGTVAGTVVDRHDRRRIMWMMDLLRGALVLAMAWLVATPGNSFVAFLVVTGLIGVASEFRMPAFSASLINIVGKENVRQASSTMQLLSTISRVGGPVLGGTLVALMGGWSALTIDALTFLISAACVLIAGHFPTPQQGKRPSRSFWSDLTMGIAAIRENPLAAAITFLSPCVNFFGNAYVVLLPVLAVKTWNATPGAFGLLEALFPLGLGIGAAIMSLLAKRFVHRGRWISGLVALHGPVIIAIGLMPTVQASFPFVTLLGVLFSLSNTLMAIAVQTEVAPEMQGRVFGTLSSLINIATPLAVGAAGFLADNLGPPLIMVGAGGCLALVGLLSLGLQGLRAYS